MTIDYQVQLIQFPNKKVREIVVENEDGSYTIFIDSSIAKELQIKAYLHALKHINGKHFEMSDVQSVEHDARFF